MESVSPAARIDLNSLIRYSASSMDEDATHSTEQQTVELTEAELIYLDKICNKPIADHQRSLRWTAIYDGLGTPLLIVGLILLKVYRKPTVTEAMVFIAFLSILNSLASFGASFVLYRHARMIHHLRAELQRARQSK